MALKYDIQNENFDYFFMEYASMMGQRQKESLPKELLYKIYIRGHRINAKSSAKLNFLEKLFVLQEAGRRWVIVFEDEKNPMGIEDYFRYKELTKKRKFTEELAQEIIDKGIFVLSNGDLYETLDRTNKLSTSAAYNYLMKVKTRDYFKPDEYKAAMNYLNRFINNYESQRKKITMETGINMAEWITLTYLYDGEEKVLSVLYKKKFKYSYNCSATKIRLAFCSLQEKGFIIRNGLKASSKFHITPLGKQKVNAIASKYIVNC